MSLPIYFDYAATTPVDPVVIKTMVGCLGLEDDFGNPASTSHTYGVAAKERVDLARSQVANALNCDEREIIFTSGATEANNLAIQGFAQANVKQGKHIITCQTEHKSVLDPCRHLESEGFEVTYLKPQSNGVIDLKDLILAFREDTVLVSIMHVNNEIGVIQDVAAMAELVKSQGAIFHVDAAQSVGKLPVDLQKMKVDLLSLCAHKFYGPKGVGALFVRRNLKLKLQAQIHGGGHERGLRSGTLATHQIAGLGAAIELAQDNMAEETARIQSFKRRLWSGLSHLPNISINGDLEQSVCGILNVCFKGRDGESLIHQLARLAVSSGSACTSATVEPSHVLKAIGLSRQDADSSLRFSFGRFTTEAEIDQAIELVRRVVS